MAVCAKNSKLNLTNHVLHSKVIESFEIPCLSADEEELYIHLENKVEAKKTIRKAEWTLNFGCRGRLWTKLCQRLHPEAFSAFSIYEDSCKQLFGGGRRPGIPPFVDRMRMYSYFLSESGLDTCIKILNVVASNHPAITYAPTLYPMCATLAHYIESESELYSCIDSLVSGHKGKMIFQTKLRFDSSINTVIQLLKRHARSSYVYVRKLVKNLDEMRKLFRNWLWWIFCDLSFDYLVRIMDCYMYEGTKVLYRVSIAIIILFHKNSGRYSKSVSDALKDSNISMAISEFASELPVNLDILMKTGFKIRNLKLREIGALELESEMISKSLLVRSLSSCSEGDDRNLAVMQRGSNLDINGDPANVISFLISSSTLMAKELLTIWSWLPTRITTLQPQVVYSSNEHGSSLISFFMKAENYEPTLLLIKTTNREVIGAYCSGSWMERGEKDDHGRLKTYFATGESFLFTLMPKCHKFPWIGIKSPDKVTHSSHLFMMADESGIAVGGGGGNHGLWLDKEMIEGRSGHCDTFNNPSLTSAAHDDFDDQSSNIFTCAIVEAIGFTAA